MPFNVVKQILQYLSIRDDPNQISLHPSHLILNPIPIPLQCNEGRPQPNCLNYLNFYFIFLIKVSQDDTFAYVCQSEVVEIK